MYKYDTCAWTPNTATANWYLLVDPQSPKSVDTSAFRTCRHRAWNCETTHPTNRQPTRPQRQKVPHLVWYFSKCASWCFLLCLLFNSHRSKKANMSLNMSPDMSPNMSPTCRLIDWFIDSLIDSLLNSLFACSGHGGGRPEGQLDKKRSLKSTTTGVVLQQSNKPRPQQANVDIHANTYADIYIYIYIYIHMFLHIYIYKHTSNRTYTCSQQTRQLASQHTYIYIYIHMDMQTNMHTTTQPNNNQTHQNHHLSTPWNHQIILKKTEPKKYHNRCGTPTKQQTNTTTSKCWHTCKYICRSEVWGVRRSYRLPPDQEIDFDSYSCRACERARRSCEGVRGVPPYRWAFGLQISGLLLLLLIFGVRVWFFLHYGVYGRL